MCYLVVCVMCITIKQACYIWLCRHLYNGHCFHRTAPPEININYVHICRLLIIKFFMLTKFNKCIIMHGFILHTLGDLDPKFQQHNNNVYLIKHPY